MKIEEHIVVTTSRTVRKFSRLAIATAVTGVLLVGGIAPSWADDVATAGTDEVTVSGYTNGYFVNNDTDETLTVNGYFLPKGVDIPLPKVIGPRQKNVYFDIPWFILGPYGDNSWIQYASSASGESVTFHARQIRDVWGIFDNESSCVARHNDESSGKFSCSTKKNFRLNDQTVFTYTG